MATPAVSTAFGDLLDPRFDTIFNNTYDELPDMIPTLFAPASNGRNQMQWSQVGTFDDFGPFAGSIDYQTMYQGYDITATPLEFASGFQVERKLYDDDQYNIMDARPSGIADAANRTRQKHAARLLVNAFGVDSMFYNHTEGVSLCSDSHTTTSGASTATGFDNKVTSALSAVAVTAARIQFVNFRGDRGEKHVYQPDELWIPPNLYGEAFEIVQSAGKPDTANNNANVHEGAYKINEWIYLSDANDWFMSSSRARKRSCFWVDRVNLEFAYVEDFDTMVAKWRAYMRYGFAWIDWRWCLGASVS